MRQCAAHQEMACLTSSRCVAAPARVATATNPNTAVAQLGSALIRSRVVGSNPASSMIRTARFVSRGFYVHDQIFTQDRGDPVLNTGIALCFVTEM